MRYFDYSFLKKMSIPPNIASMLYAIGKNKQSADIFYFQYPTIFKKLENIAILQSVQSSNAIEGILSTDQRIKEIVNEKTEPKNHNEKEIAGYRDALNLIHQQHDAIDIDLEDILMLHKKLLSIVESPFAGKLKTVDNFIMQNKNNEKKVIFKTLPAKDTLYAMQQLQLAYISSRSDFEINPLFLIPCYILDFLSIHPFSDGNGRMSRLLTILLLYQNDFNIVKYVSLENIINQDKSLYYDALHQSSSDWNINMNTYFPFIEYFLTVLLSAYNQLTKRIDIINNQKLSKAERIEQTIKKTLGK